jgi:transcription elongation factor Elf1
MYKCDLKIIRHGKSVICNGRIIETISVSEKGKRKSIVVCDRCGEEYEINIAYLYRIK